MSAAINHNPEIENFAAQLSEAIAETNSRSAVLTAAENHRDKIGTRISALNAERAAIAARRQAGQGSPDDGSKLALIAVDLESLDAMLPDAVDRVNAAKSSFDAASNAAARLREAISQAEAVALRDLLVPHAAALADKLLETIKAIAETGKRAGIGGRPPWGACRELRDALRRLAAERSEL